MTEKLLQFIWQMQYFNKHDLQTAGHEPVSIIFPGRLNTHQGPDFTAASIRINNTTWAGSIELHVKASDWKQHGHSGDSNYKNVILHVVWKNDCEVTDDYGNELPTLVLEDRVSKLLLQRYEELMHNQSHIPCEKSCGEIPDLVWLSWKERLIVERLQRKTTVIKSYLEQTSNHWEEVFWWLIARNFGITANANGFELIARSISINILAKHKTHIHQVEAILLGQAGLLEQHFDEDYPVMLQKEFRFLKKKYKLNPIVHPIYFLRMRPQNFPTVRLAQLSMLIHQSAHLFSQVKAAGKLDDIRKLLTVTANDYWHYHYRLNEKTSYQEKTLGMQSVNNIIINTIVPAVFTYGYIHNEPVYKDKAVRWLQDLPSENNAVTRTWKLTGIANKNAFDSQSLNELTRQYCFQKHCLSCAVGNAVLKR
ncbi:MAG: DUF2851 family protein [Agriterribacter sp.]